MSNDFGKDESLSSCEKWTGAKYSVELLSEKNIKSWTEASRTDFELRRPNPYLAENFEISENEPSRDWSEIRKIISDSKGELWFKADGKFNLPRGIVVFWLRSNLTSKDVQNAAFKGKLSYNYCKLQ